MEDVSDPIGSSSILPRLPNELYQKADALAGVFGPAATIWYKQLEKIKLPNKNAEILARVAADQVVFASTNLLVFLSTMSVLEGSDPKEKLDKSYKTALTKNYMVWPWVQMVNFKLVPLEHRVLVVNVVSLGELDPVASGVQVLGPWLMSRRMELLSQLHQQPGWKVELAAGLISWDWIFLAFSLAAAFFLTTPVLHLSALHPICKRINSLIEMTAMFRHSSFCTQPPYRANSLPLL